MHIVTQLLQLFFSITVKKRRLKWLWRPISICTRSIVSLELRVLERMQQGVCEGASQPKFRSGAGEEYTKVESVHRLD